MDPPQFRYRRSATIKAVILAFLVAGGVATVIILPLYFTGQLDPSSPSPSPAPGPYVVRTVLKEPFVGALAVDAAGVLYASFNNPGFNVTNPFKINVTASTCYVRRLVYNGTVVKSNTIYAGSNITKGAGAMACGNPLAPFYNATQPNWAALDAQVNQTEVRTALGAQLNGVLGMAAWGSLVSMTESLNNDVLLLDTITGKVTRKYGEFTGQYHGYAPTPPFATPPLPVPPPFATPPLPVPPPLATPPLPVAGRKLAAPTIIPSYSSSETENDANHNAKYQNAFSRPTGITVDPVNNIFVTSGACIKIMVPGMDIPMIYTGKCKHPNFVDGDAVVAQFNTGLGGIAADSRSNLFVADTNNSAVRFVLFNGDPYQCSACALSRGPCTVVCGSPITFTLGTPGVDFNQPTGVAVAPGVAGGAYVVDAALHQLKLVQTQDGTTSTVTLLAGTGVPGAQDGRAQQATFDTPSSIAVDARRGIVYVGDKNGIRAFAAL